MSRPRLVAVVRPLPTALLGLVLSCPPVAADGLFEIRARAEPAADVLEVRLELVNHGRVPVEAVTVEAHLAGSRDFAALGRPIAPEETRPVLLRFPLAGLLPGLQALRVRVDGIPQTGVVSRSVSQPAALLLGLGGSLPGPPVRLTVSPVSFAFAGAVRIGVESLDGRPHRVSLEILAGRGLRAIDPEVIDVPAAGSANVSATLFRGSAPFDSRQSLVVIAAVADGGAAIAAGEVTIRPDPAWLPALKVPLALVALGLLAFSILVEWPFRPHHS